MAATLAGWITYAGLRGRVVVDEPSSEQALVRAQDYIRQRLATISDPGTDATDEATYIAAGYELDTPGFWGATYTPSQSKVLTKVDKIEWTVVPNNYGSGIDALMPMSPLIESLLLPYRYSGLGVFVV